ncbi:LptF/LptG family permease [Bombella apis]|uniref:LptF/LptG family permease n=1 Tax=Bombella apis TaxID=1785988 RepID=UPI0024A80307|nr:LptF/LptG family permease [Bombella apis]
MRVLPSNPTLLQVFLKPLLTKILLCCGVLTALLEILALLDDASTILDRHLGISGLFRYIGLHLPTLIVEIMPLSVMIGGLFTLLQMALSSEIAVLRAAGLSTLNMFRYLLPIPLLLGVICMAMQLWVIPPCEQELNRWWNEGATQANATDDLHSLWFRLGTDIIHVETISHGGRNLSKVIFYRRQAENGNLAAAQYYENLVHEGGHWINHGIARQLTVSNEQTQVQLSNEPPPPTLTASPQEIINMTLQGVYYTPHQFWKIFSGKVPSNLPRSNYLMALYATLMLPVQMAVMLLITLPITYIPPRAGLRNPLPVYVMAAGLGVVILQGMISALGNSGSLPILIAISSGQIVAALFGLAWILRMEEK